MLDVNYTIIKEIVTNTVRLRLLDNDIVHYTFLADSEICENEHQQNHHALIALIGTNKKLPLLIDAEGQTSITPEGRSLVRKLEPLAPISKRAIVIKTLSDRMLANFYITFHKPFVPTKIFNNCEDAKKWLSEF